MSKKKDDSFARHVEELLAPLGGVAVRSMFGGYGIYQDGLMFALIADDTLYLKVDKENEARFVEKKLAPFVYESPKGSMTMSYRRAPDSSLDDGEELREWARTSISAAVRNKKPSKTTKKSAKKSVKKTSKKSATKRKST